MDKSIITRAYLKVTISPITLEKKVHISRSLQCKGNYLYFRQKIPF